MPRALFRRACAACVLLAAITGCGGDDEGGGSSDGPTTLTVQVLPITDVVPIYLGIEKGFFKEEDLTIKTQTAQGGAEIIPQVINGSVHRLLEHAVAVHRGGQGPAEREVTSLRISQDDLNLILGGNAARVFGLEPPFTRLFREAG